MKNHGGSLTGQNSGINSGSNGEESPGHSNKSGRLKGFSYSGLSEIPHHPELSGIDFISLFETMDDGVIITDKKGVILFYNSAQARIDDLETGSVLGLKVTDIYALNDNTSLIMQSIARKSAVRNRIFFYRTCSGKVANTITSVYPIFRGRSVTGAVCFVRDAEFLQKSNSSSAINECRPDFGNGSRFSFADIITGNAEFERGVNIARKAANSSSPVMLFGETGTGKELFAQSIHNHSFRNQQKYVALNCAAIPEDLLEGLLFGTTKGAFTGAMDKPGLFEMANGGSIFLDELLAMPVNLQAKLLRVLQEKKVRRVGSLNEISVNVKIISSVSSDPRIAIKDNQLRIDLFYRLGVVVIKIPPLRERRDAIPELVSHFIEKLNVSLGTHVKGVSSGVMSLFMEYHWPGNVRELEHLIEGAMNLVGQEDTIELKHFSSGVDTFEDENSHPRECRSPIPGTYGIQEAASSIQSGEYAGDFRRDDTVKEDIRKEEMKSSELIMDVPAAHFENSPRTLVEFQEDNERNALINALETTTGNVTKAAQKLGISRQLLHYKIKKYGLLRKHFL